MEDAVLTNRETAAVVVLILLVVFILTRPGRADLTKSISGVLVTLASRAILVPIFLYIMWISAGVLVAARFGAWDASLLKTTILWLVLSGVALVMRLNDAIESPGFFRTAVLQTLGIACAVLEHVSKSNKEQRILQAFDPLLAAAALRAHTAVWASPFIEEMREWRPGRRCRDDGLDAVSGCLLAEPVRLPRAGPGKRIDWRPGRSVLRATIDFDP